MGIYWQLIGVVASGIIWIASRYVKEEIVINRHGTHAPKFQCWFPTDFLAGLYFIWSITRHALKNQSVEFLHNCFSRTGKGLTELVLGRDIRSLASVGENEFAQAHKRLLHTQSLIERTTPFNFLIPRDGFRRDKGIVDAVFQPTIDKALSMSQDELNKLDSEDGDWAFAYAVAAISKDPKFLMDELQGIFIAGRDTTSQTLAFAFYELARNPHIVSELRCIIGDVVGLGQDAKRPTYEDLKRMTFLTHIINETLRLYPNVPINIRQALKDTSLPKGGGPDGNLPIGIPAGTSVIYSTQILQLSPEIYPPVSPNFPPIDEFDPHRWTKWTPKPWTYIPFNGGPRICIGQQLAMIEMAYVITRVFQQFTGLKLNKVVTAGSSGCWLRRDVDPDSAERFICSRIPLGHEISLQPRGPIELIFSS
ncbi:cytochrome P450 52A11 [Colletotrichum graminicola M1.001]|uniref:Cytochrome P450 52A11 n=1 Tax=Colletotrichum graminicola (strain M1.001 / M2 / FGSC 10212) TaxID=645133 RepID=E3R0Q0_COLGM|nr:cytochrome P450 52A11 [Colletotrichum graminicola M1.001]EFQ36688.1 cytochrome P450 52A11 [Colletotrichum graminicola M1.001]